MVFGHGSPAQPPWAVKPRRALGELLRNRDPDPFTLFDASLELLIRQFKVDHALITRLSQGKLDTFWWVQAGAGAREPVELHQSLRLCERVLLEPEGRLALGTVFPSEGGPWLRAFAGVALYERGRPVGTLAVLHSHTYAFSPDDLDFIHALAGLLGRVMEIENLRYQLQVAQNSLDLSSAVVQDSALESPATGLPNSRYLEVWLKSSMSSARRQKESLSLALWELTGRVAKAALQRVGKSLRGDDLLAEVSANRILLLLPRTRHDGAEALLERLRAELGDTPMGATVWLPDWDDLLLHGALRRAEVALQEAIRAGGGTQWKVPTQVLLD
jgi:GGDEF domain-containing protein